MDIMSTRSIHITPSDSIKNVVHEKGVVAIHFDGGDSLFISEKKLKEVMEYLDDEKIGFRPKKCLKNAEE